MEKYKIRTTRELLVEYNKIHVKEQSLDTVKDEAIRLEEEMNKIEKELSNRLTDVIIILKSVDKILAPFEIERLCDMLNKRF